MISNSYIYIANDRVPTHQEYLLHPSMTVIAKFTPNCNQLIAN